MRVPDNTPHGSLEVDRVVVDAWIVGKDGRISRCFFEVTLDQETRLVVPADLRLEPDDVPPA